jgi:GH24 family phage-related lysozyme (muramidase)
MSAAESEQEALREELTKSKSETETLVAEVSTSTAHAARTETRLQEIKEALRAEEEKMSALVAKNESTRAALAGFIVFCGTSRVLRKFLEGGL